jgi:mono/diheme cytochrome c family protein
MQRWIVAAALCAAACQQEPHEAAQLSYEGADYKTQAAKWALGKRLADVLDCTGCHGPNLQGTDLADKPEDGAMYAPNITLLLGKYSDAELDRLIRHGEPRDGREFWFMPVESYQFLSDPDFAALVAYLRTVKPAGKPLPAFKFNRVEYRDVEQGLLGNAKAQIRKYRDDRPVDMGRQHAWGRYLVQTTCTTCHNNALQGWKHFTPDLDIAGAYSAAELETLLTTGKGKSKPDLGMMSEMGRRVFPKFTPRERAAVIAYVKARADRPQPAGAN